MEKEMIVGIDVGGTKVNITMGELDGQGLYKELAQKKIATDAQNGGGWVLENIKDSVLKLLDKHSVALSEVRAVGVGVPGVVDQVNHQTSGTENIPGWDQLQVYDKLQKVFPFSQVLMENDVNLAALSELYPGGAASNYNNFIFIAVGTGVGCGIIVDQKLYKGYCGAAGEIGFMRISQNNTTASLEEWFSGKGISDRLPKGMLIKDALDLYQAQREPGFTVVSEALTALEQAVANLVYFFAPDAIILGGGVVLKNSWMCEHLRNGLGKLFLLNPLKVELARHGEDAPLKGTIQLIKSKRQSFNGSKGSRNNGQLLEPRKLTW